MDRLITIVEAVRRPLAAAKSGLNIGRGATIGFEGGAAFDPSGYASTYIYGAAIEHLLTDVFAGADLRDATSCLAELRSVLTDCELRRLRTACAIARGAYEDTVAAIRIGVSARAYAAFQSRSRAIADGDFVLLHYNSYCDSFWTDITRTFRVGHVSNRQRAMSDAVDILRQSTLEAIRPGVRAESVDKARPRRAD